MIQIISVLTFLSFCLFGIFAHSAGLHQPITQQCDIFIAGGSLASLAAAITAANSTNGIVCFTELTDWPGGQLISSAVPAVDFGPENTNPPNPNLPAVFNEMMAVFKENPGNCWVSYKCFQPQEMLQKWITPTLQKYSNLKVFLMTAVTAASIDAQGNVVSVQAVQRTPTNGTTGWETLTSTQLLDWYNPQDSAFFTKQVINFTGFKVAVEATEFGDLLGTSGLPYAQGIESPDENSTSYIDYCGQGTTIPFYMEYSNALQPLPDPVPAGGPEGLPFSMEGSPWSRIWTYRRVLSVGNSNTSIVVQGEVSNQNWGDGNDFDNGYLFLPVSHTRGLPWTGGINITALAAAEQRAYGWYHWYKQYADAAVQPYLTLNYTMPGTATGLAKLPYLRDSRRSAMGIQGFRLFWEALDNCTYPGPIPRAEGAAQLSANCSTGYHFRDTVGIGVYFYADTHKMKQNCPYPAYFNESSPVLPYYIPFRALTVAASPNLLVAGKSMAQTFRANSGTRLHPEEWVTGTAAGAAAALMLEGGFDTTDVYNHIQDLQVAVEKLGSPLEWTLHRAK